jgi:hypothetical protein
VSVCDGCYEKLDAPGTVLHVANSDWVSHRATARCAIHDQPHEMSECGEFDPSIRVPESEMLSGWTYPYVRGCEWDWIFEGLAAGRSMFEMLRSLRARRDDPSTVESVR